jgi:hypothetical protein
MIEQTLAATATNQLSCEVDLALLVRDQSGRLESRAQPAPAQDDEEERRVRLMLLGKVAVLANRYEHPLAAEMDDDQQS